MIRLDELSQLKVTLDRRLERRPSEPSFDYSVRLEEFRRGQSMASVHAGLLHHEDMVIPASRVWD